MVAETGLTDGLDDVDVKPVGKLVHEYLYCATAGPPIEMDPEQIAVLGIIETEGEDIVETLMELVLLH